ncbi:hypothetical protein BLNAU_12324 [Blattamonas nauphoetae]|uniref:Uncharacterized protein n=1 Tax=Blattamonas nauphoetae TaxID=2049346 RepID=A0ABQ9XR58_9EUKA|nr:hypothetical protein BLNAU_12324 [Blattamonas nauphoetae]
MLTGYLEVSDSTPFLNWDDSQQNSIPCDSPIFMSLVSMIHNGYNMLHELVEKAKKLLSRMMEHEEKQSNKIPQTSQSAQSTERTMDVFFNSLAILLSSPSTDMNGRALNLISKWLESIPPSRRLSLLDANLIPHIVNTLQPHTVPLADNDTFHYSFLSIITSSTIHGLSKEPTNPNTFDTNTNQTVHDTILRKVVFPSEEYFNNLCHNRFSCQTKVFSESTVTVIHNIFTMCACHPPTLRWMQSSCFPLLWTSFLDNHEKENSLQFTIWCMVNTCQRWKKDEEEVRKRGNEVIRVLNEEGQENDVEQKLMTNGERYQGTVVRRFSFELSTLLGLNLPQLE